MLVSRLVQQVRKHDPTNDVADMAMDYLRRKDMTGSILREASPSPSTSGDGLEYITTADLFDEIAIRHECTVLLYITSPTDQEDMVFTEWRGRPTTALGLITRAKHRMLSFMNNQEGNSSHAD
jgi:hypothetical protein